MKKLIFVALLLYSTTASSYMIGGAYASLVSCVYGQHGYQYGNIGTYNVQGKLYKLFFGTRYCPI